MGTPFRERTPDLDGHDPTALVDAARLAAEGVTFGGGPFHLDPVPRVIAAADWSALEAGLVQRVRALDAFCADVYGERRIVRDGVIPARVMDTTDPLRARALAHARGLGRARERPPPLDNPADHRLTALRTERSVSVNLHPVPSLGELSGMSTAQPPRRPGWLPHRPNNVVRIYI